METTIQLRQQYDYNKKQVLFLIGISEQQLADMIVFMATEWAGYFFNGLVDYDKLIDNGLYANWFQRYWFQFDDACILTALYGIQKQYRYLQYRQSHQTVFDDSLDEVQYMKKDFLSMLPKFLK